MAFKLPPPPTSNDPNDPAFRDWFYKLQQYLTNIGNIFFTELNFTGSNLTSIQTRNHTDLQNIQGGAPGNYFHLTSQQVSDLTQAAARSVPVFFPDDATDDGGVIPGARGDTGLQGLQGIQGPAGVTAIIMMASDDGEEGSMGPPGPAGPGGGGGPTDMSNIYAFAAAHG